MNLTGPIGPLAYYLPQLTMLDLSNNQLSGVLPPDLSAVYSGLLHLNLSSNAMYGEHNGETIATSKECAAHIISRLTQSVMCSPFQLITPPEDAPSQGRAHVGTSVLCAAHSTAGVLAITAGAVFPLQALCFVASSMPSNLQLSNISSQNTRMYL
jgi:hypothetical protein